MAPFYRWGLTDSRLELFQAGSLLFITIHASLYTTYIRINSVKRNSEICIT